MVEVSVVSGSKLVLVVRLRQHALILANGEDRRLPIPPQYQHPSCVPLAGDPDVATFTVSIAGTDVASSEDDGPKIPPRSLKGGKAVRFASAGCESPPESFEMIH